MVEDFFGGIEQQYEAIRLWALIVEVSLVACALGVLIMTVTVVMYAVQSINRQDDLLKIERARWQHEQGLLHIAQAQGLRYGPRN